MVTLFGREFVQNGQEKSLKTDVFRQIVVEIGGIRVYRSANIEKNRFVWIDGMSVCSLTTTCDVGEAEAIVSSFREQ